MPILFTNKQLETVPQEGMCLRIVTDFPSSDDVSAGFLFSDYEGKLLRRWIRETGFSAFDPCMEFVSLWKKPDTLSSFESSLVGKTSPKRVESAGLFATGKYLSKDMFDEAMGQIALMKEQSANMTIVLGSAAGKLLSGQRAFKLERARGAVGHIASVGGKGLYTFHPRHVRTKWKDYSIALMDFIKAFGQANTSDFTPPKGKIHVAETITDIKQIEKVLCSAEVFSLDIETMPLGSRGAPQIDVIGFGVSSQEAYIIPIFDRFKLGQADFESIGREASSYAGEWTAEEELFVWDAIERICASPARKELQNGLYDSWILWRRYGIALQGGFDDTMIRHHCLHCELPKGLDVLGSLYTDRTPWKDMRQFGHKGE